MKNQYHPRIIIDTNTGGLDFYDFYPEMSYLRIVIIHEQDDNIDEHNEYDYCHVIIFQLNNQQPLLG